MSRRNLPKFAADSRPAGVSCEISETVLAKWNPGLKVAAAADGAPSQITIFDPIGADPWSGNGVTANRIGAALRSIGRENPVDVLVNSPGGDVFEGIAIYNLLREHKGEVRVQVIGVAASIASVIAMAGDSVQIARSAFFMIHNSWVLAGGNRHDLRAVADTLEPFDAAMADIYAARTGLTDKAVGKLMDAETWINGEDAVAQGFADSLLDVDLTASEDTKQGTRALREAERRLQASGLSRAQSRRMLAEIRQVERDADLAGVRDAVEPRDDVTEALAELRATVQTIISR